MGPKTRSMETSGRSSARWGGGGRSKRGGCHRTARGPTPPCCRLPTGGATLRLTSSLGRRCVAIDHLLRPWPPGAGGCCWLVALLGSWPVCRQQLSPLTGRRKARRGRLRPKGRWDQWRRVLAGASGLHGVASAAFGLLSARSWWLRPECVGGPSWLVLLSRKAATRWLPVWARILSSRARAAGAQPARPAFVGVWPTVGAWLVLAGHGWRGPRRPTSRSVCLAGTIAAGGAGGKGWRATA